MVRPVASCARSQSGAGTGAGLERPALRFEKVEVPGTPPRMFRRRVKLILPRLQLTLEPFRSRGRRPRALGFS